MLGNVTQSGSDTEGRMALGGTAQLANYSVGYVLPNSNGTRDDLIVGGNTTYNSGQVNNGNAVHSGTGSYPNVGFPHGTARQGTILNFNSAFTTLRANSTHLAGLTVNGTTTFQYGTLTLTGNNAGLNVFTVLGSNLATANGLNITAPAGSTVIVNINGTADGMQNFGINVNGTDRQHVIYNFYQATGLTLGGIGVQGSILAPWAAINFTSGQINGNLIGASLTGNGQTNLSLFTGCTP